MFLIIFGFVLAVQHERGPRNSTIRRQIELYSKDMMPSTDLGYPMNTMPEPNRLPPAMPLALSLFPNPFTHFTGFNLLNSPPVITRPTFVPPVLPVMSSFHHGNDPEKQCEAAARLLFLNVKWTKSIVSFESLSLPDRLLLIEESWTELFVLGVAQYIYPIDLNAILRQGLTRIDRTYVDTFESVLREIARAGPDNEEYAHLRSLILFKTNLNGVGFDGRRLMRTQDRRLRDLPAIAEVQSRAQTALNIVSNFVLGLITLSD